MTRSARRRLALLPALALLGGCLSDARETTTDRAAEEMLLLSAAVERAVQEYDASELAGKRVAIEVAYLDALDEEPYLVSAMRQHLAHAGAHVVEASAEARPEVVLEIRRASLAINDPEFVIGIPRLPLGLIGLADIFALSPELTFGYDPQIAWAKVQFWLYEADTRAFLGQQTLWGRAETGWFEDIWTQSRLETAVETVRERLGVGGDEGEGEAPADGDAGEAPADGDGDETSGRNPD